MPKKTYKDFGLTSGGMTQPERPKKRFATKEAKTRMMKKSAPRVSQK